MNISKLTLRKETAFQQSNTTKILEWMQAHPNFCRNTNAAVMAKAICLETGGNFDSIRQRIQKMTNLQMINRFGTKARSNFFINYLHKDIPQYILDNAPEEYRNLRRDMEAGLKVNQHLDSVGCKVTPIEKKTTQKPVKEKTIEKETIEEESVDKQQSEPIEASKEETPEQIEIPVTVTKISTPSTTNLSITLNINLNA